MAGGHFLTLLHSTSRSSLVKPIRPFFYNSTKNYREASNGNRSSLMAERAPSIAEEFQRVAEEKAREAKKDGTIGDSKVESIKNRFKHHEPEADYNRRGD
ncbi:uncharacterized protein LOC133288515 [Gastrolobium bilobum]|uniref:uncharacterized protein LOC133288515 n=1 Tax=Gastrolobium bilobum TaxID=150636 RepID=UPI002AB1179A|nr:uncharacterized protein LOC133288515 [Gastrolobium bilobum]